MRGKTSWRVSLFLMSFVLVSMFFTTWQTPFIASSAGQDSAAERLIPAFNGNQYSDTWSARPVEEYLFGENQSLRNIAGTALNVFGPSGGTWTGRNFTTTVFGLYETRNFTKNPDFSGQNGPLPSDWSSYSTDSTDLTPTYTAGQYVYIQAANYNFPRKENASWTQQIYVNRANIRSAWLLFKAWRTGQTGSPLINASIYVDHTKVWTSQWLSLGTSRPSQSTNLSLPLSLFQGLPGSLSLSLNMSLTSAYDNKQARSVTFDDVYLYLYCQPYPESVGLKLGTQPVTGSNYGSGKTTLLDTILPFTRSFSSNSTVCFNSSSTLRAYRMIQSESVNFNATQGDFYVNWNVNRSSALDNLNQVFGSIRYTQYSLNVSIPHRWEFLEVRTPSGQIKKLGDPGIERIDNASATWIIRLNVTTLGSCRPDPYSVRARTLNAIPYQSGISIYGSSGGGWTPREPPSFFEVGSSIMINATSLAPQGTAYVVFYRSVNHAVHRDMQLFSVTPNAAGNATFIFNWADENVSRNSDLLVVVRWNNGSDVGVNWKTITFDLPPFLAVPSPVNGQWVHGVVTVQVTCVDDKGLKNVTLIIGGVSKQNWTLSGQTLVTSYDWDTKGLANGSSQSITLRAFDNLDHFNQSVLSTVRVDNERPTKPTLLSPNDLETLNTASPTLIWASSSDSVSGVEYYVLELDTSSDFNSSNLRSIQLPVTPTNYAVPGNETLSAGTWHWRVCAEDMAGNQGPYSSYRSFQVVLPGPSEGIPPLLIVGLGGIPVAVLLGSLVYVRRRRMGQAESFDRKSLIACYVFSGDGRGMFSHEFREINVDSQLLSGFLTAISQMMKEVIGSGKRPLKTIDRGDAKILIEQGNSVMGALVGKKNSPEYRRRLRAFVNRFEDDYADSIAEWDGDESVYATAGEALEEVFSPTAKVTTYPTISGLDDLLVSGKLSGFAVSIAGKTGSGKTEFVMSYAASLLKRAKQVIVVAASLSPTDVREQLSVKGIDIAKSEKQGYLTVFDAFSEMSGVKSKEKYSFGSPGELNNINLTLTRSLLNLSKATIIFDSLSAMMEYSELDLVGDFTRTMKAKLKQGGHTAFFVVDSNAHDKKTLNYILSWMDGEIETVAETTGEREPHWLVSFKRLRGYKVRPGFHEFK